MNEVFATPAVGAIIEERQALRREVYEETGIEVTEIAGTHILP